MMYETPICFPWLDALHDSSAAPYFHVTEDLDVVRGILPSAKINNTISSNHYNTSQHHASLSEIAKGTVISISSITETILAISYLRSTEEPLVWLYIDVPHSVVISKAFAISNDAVQIVWIDIQHAIYTIRFSIASSTCIAIPCPNNGFNDVRCYTELKTQNEQINTILSNSMINFIGPDTVLIAWNPKLLCIDLLNQDYTEWNVEKCLQNNIGLFRRILGKGSSDIPVVHPVAAICRADNIVFTLHSDGCVRRWDFLLSNNNNNNDINNNTCYEPTSVTTLNVKHIPQPSMWRGTVQMTSRIYNNDRTPIFVLAICISTYKNELIVANGVVEDFEDEERNKVYSIQLNVPNNVGDTLVGMQLDAKVTDTSHSIIDTSQGRCQLRVLFGSGMFLTYGPSQVSIVAREPVCYNLDQEYQQTIPRFLLYENDDGSLRERLHAIDTFYMCQLFRPRRPRGNGTNLSPAVSHIRRVMKELEPLYHSSSRSVMNATSIEVDVLKFMHEWRERNHFLQLTSSTSTPKQQTTATPARTTQTSATSGFHDTLEEKQDNVTRNENDSTTNMEVDGEDNNKRDDKNINREADDHEQRWRQFLQRVYETEARAELTLLAFILPNTTKDTAIVVRRAFCATLQDPIETTSSSSSVLIHIDTLAKDMSAWIKSEKEQFDLMEISKQKISEFCCNAQLALDPSSVESEIETLFETCAEMDCLQDDQGRKRSVAKESDDNILKKLKEASIEDSLGVLKMLTDSTHEKLPGSKAQYPVCEMQTRVVGASMFVKVAEAASELWFNRFLILSLLNKNLSAKHCMRMYLHALCVLDVAARTVPFPPLVTIDSSFRQLQLGSSSPPKKRSKRIASVLEFNGTKDKTVALDSLLIQISQRVPNSFNATTKVPMASLPLMIAQFAIRVAFMSYQNAVDHEMKELGFIDFKNSKEISQPGLALRLLAPHTSSGSSELQKLRAETMAKCLLMAASSVRQERAEKMVKRAFELLQFDIRDISQSMKNIEILRSGIPKENEVGSNIFLRFIEQAIVDMGTFDLDKCESYETLWSILFSTAISVRKWDTAFGACTNHPNLKCRTENLGRLVRAMVDSGFVMELQRKCAGVGDTDTLRHGVDLYEVAVTTLSDLGNRNWYTEASIAKESPADYLGALYALHESKKQWRRVAAVCDVRYVKARQALSNAVLDLTPLQQERREALIIDDLVTGSILCYQAMKRVSDNQQYLVSGEGELTSIGTSYQNSVKHDRTGALVVFGDKGSDHSGDFLTLNDIELRAERSKALKTLFEDNLCKKSFVRCAFVEEGADAISDHHIVKKLFALGHYPEGFSFAAVIDHAAGVKPGGRREMHLLICDLITGTLIPLAYGGSPLNDRPSIRQLQAGIDWLHAPGGQPASLYGGHLRKASVLNLSFIRDGAMALIQELVRKFTCHEEPVALYTARALLLPNPVTTQLPSWLEHILLVGFETSDVPGLFARRRDPDSSAYLGDPAALLHLYIHSGLYCEACRVVCLVLAGVKNNYRADVAASRLPEKGEIDFIPHSEIDLLWNLIEMTLEGKIPSEYRRKLENERSKMEEAFKKYVDLQRTTEAGLASARILA